MNSPDAVRRRLEKGHPERAGQRFRTPSATANESQDSGRPARQPSDRNDGSGQNRHERSKCEQGFSSNAREWSATPSARSDGFNNVDGSPDCGVYIQMRGIEQVRICSGL
jgi:hypothetical protein